MITLRAPVDLSEHDLEVGLLVKIEGKIYLGRDAVLPRPEMVDEIEGGSILMHGGYSDAGYGVTTSNKKAIEGSMVRLSRSGVKVHIGKGRLSDVTVKGLDKLSIFVTTPPTNGLFKDILISRRVVAFEEEGMEALHEIVVGKNGVQGIIAAWGGKALWQ